MTGLAGRFREEDGLEILHFRMRSEAQFTRKIVNRGSAYERNTHLDPEIGTTWRHLYTECLTNGLEDHYQSAVVDQGDDERLLGDGVIVFDTRLRSYACAFGAVSELIPETSE